MSRKLFTALGTVGGTATDLDYISQSSLPAGTDYIAMVWDDTRVLFYYYDPASIEATSDPNFVRPTDFVSAGVWVLMQSTDGIGAFDWEYVNSNTNAVNLSGYIVDTSGGSVTIGSFSSPTLGDQFSVKDYDGSFNTNSCYVGDSGDKFEGVTGPYEIKTGYFAGTFVYVDATVGYVIVSSHRNSFLYPLPSGVLAEGNLIGLSYAKTNTDEITFQPFTCKDSDNNTTLIRTASQAVDTSSLAAASAWVYCFLCSDGTIRVDASEDGSTSLSSYVKRLVGIGQYNSGGTALKDFYYVGGLLIFTNPSQFPLSSAISATSFTSVDWTAYIEPTRVYMIGLVAQGSANYMTISLDNSSNFKNASALTTNGSFGMVPYQDTVYFKVSDNSATAYASSLCLNL